MSIHSNITSLLLAVAMAASTAASCNKALEGTEAGQQDEEYTFTCVIVSDEADSKVSVSEQGKTRWEAGDRILVHGEGSSNRTIVTLAASDISADGKTAKIGFSGITPYDRSADGVTSTFYAAYPADVVNSGNLYWYATFKETNLPLLAAFNQGNTFRFYHCCGAISFRVSGDFDSYEFEGLNGETLGYDTYEAKVVYKSGATLDFNHWTVGPKTVLESTVVADGSTPNFIYIPQGVNFTGGFKFRFKKGGELVKTATSVKPVDVARGKMAALGNITSHLKDPSSAETHQSGIDMASAIELGSNGTANCYIVEDPGTYKFKAVKGNSSQSVGEVASVEVIWETLCTADAPAKGSVIEKVDFEGNYICFKTPSGFTPGNALIAAKNASGNIIWSWHIWIPASGISTGTYKIAASEMMDRNLGALVTAPSGGDGRSFGLFYQWGRKDPFPGMKGISSTGVVGVTGTATSVVQFGAVTNTDKTVADGIANPTVFYTTQNNSWLATDDDDLWGGKSGSKSIYDPCPPGYKVPGETEAAGLFATLTDITGWASDTGAGYFQVGNPAVTFPYAGYIDDYISSPGSYSRAGERAMVWSSHGSATKAYSLDVRSDSSPISAIRKSNPKARGGAVRCVSEEMAPFVNEPGMPVMGNYTKTDFSSSQMAELSGLCFSKDGDFMWGVGDGGTLYKIDFNMNVTVHKDWSTNEKYDLEGVTMDPSTKDLYVCTEANKVRKIAAPGYDTVTTIITVTDAANFGNSGLEGITWYKDNVIYTGSQSGAWLWAYNINGTLVWKKQLGPLAPGLQEVGDLYYDPTTDLLWVSDSEAFKLYVFDGAVTTLKAQYDIKFIGNPESVLVDHSRNVVWVGDDRGSSSRIYKISFSNL